MTTAREAVEHAITIVESNPLATGIATFSIANALRAYLASLPSPEASAEAVGEVVGDHRVGFHTMPTIRWSAGFTPSLGTKLYASAPSVTPDAGAVEPASLDDAYNNYPNSHWKVGNEFKPYHPSASHVDPSFRDGWNRAYYAAIGRAGEKK